MRTFNFVFGSCLLAQLAVLAGCAPGTSSHTQGSVIVGAVIDRSGINSEPSWADAIYLAQHHANTGLAQAHLTKLSFGVVVSDSGNEPTVAVAKAQQLVQKSGARALVVDTSQNDVAIHRLTYDADPTNDLNVPLLCGGCTSAALNDPAALDTVDPINQATLRNGQGWNFRGLMSTKLISEVLVRMLLQNNGGDVNGDGVLKVAFYGSDETFGHGAAKDLKAFLNQLHPSPAPIVEEVYHPRDADPNSYDWNADLVKLTDRVNSMTGAADGFPDVIVVANFAQQQAAIVKAYAQSKSAIRMLHYHSMRFSSVLQSLGALSEGSEGVSHVLLDDGASGAVFQSDYRALYGTDVAYRDAIYYDSAMVLMLASVIASGGVDDPSLVTGDKLRSAIPLTSVPGAEVIRTGTAEFAHAVQLIQQGVPINYEGASGPMDFDANGNLVGRLARFQARGGAFVDLEKFDCVASPSCPSTP